MKQQFSANVKDEKGHYPVFTSFPFVVTWEVSMLLVLRSDEFLTYIKEIL